MYTFVYDHVYWYVCACVYALPARVSSINALDSFSLRGPSNPSPCPPCAITKFNRNSLYKAYNVTHQRDMVSMMHREVVLVTNEEV